MKLLIVLTALVGIAVSQPPPDLGQEIHEVVEIILQQDPDITITDCTMKCDIIFDREQRPAEGMCQHECRCAIEGVPCSSFPPPEPTGSRPPPPTGSRPPPPTGSRPPPPTGSRPPPPTRPPPPSFPPFPPRQ